MEIVKEEFETTEVMCNNCVGILNLILIEDKSKERLFKTQYYQNVALQCNHCLKVGKIFKRKIRKK